MIYFLWQGGRKLQNMIAKQVHLYLDNGSVQIFGHYQFVR